MSHQQLEKGERHRLVCTDARIEDKVQLRNCRIAMIGEQHRFGVEQRTKLWKKKLVAGACAGDDGNVDTADVGDEPLWRSGYFSD